MNESFGSNVPEPKVVGVWTEGARIEPKEFVIPKNSPESSDDIPTIPDLDDIQDILEKEIANVPNTEQKNSETVNTLAAVSDGYSGSADGVEAVLAALRLRVPPVQSAPDAVWTIDSLLTQLAEEGNGELAEELENLPLATVLDMWFQQDGAPPHFAVAVHHGRTAFNLVKADPTVFRRVRGNLFLRCKKCIEVGGGHIENNLQLANGVIIKNPSD